MFRITKKIVRIFLMCYIFAFSTLILSCSEVEEEKPTIVDCNTIKYKGETQSNIGCRSGISSIRIQREGWPVMYIQCSMTSGCIESVSLQ
jgi:hypothetical protein